MQLRCKACNKVVTLSETTNLITVSLCERTDCDWPHTFVYKGHRGTVAYWETRDDQES